MRVIVTLTPRLAAASRLALLALCLLVTGGLSHAQEARITAHELEKSEGFADAQGFARLQTDLIYIDHLEGEIPMDGAPRYQPPEEERERSDGQGVEVTNQVLLVIVLALAAWLAWKFGRPVLERWGIISREIKRTQDENGNTLTIDDGYPVESDLIARLKAMKDREAALIELVQAILPVAARANGLRLTRSETARELLRRLPKTWPHLSDLRRIVMTEELVQFGGRPLEEASFLDCLTRAQPIVTKERL